MVKTRPGIVISDQNQVEDSSQKKEIELWKAKAETYKGILMEAMGGCSCGKK